MSQIMPACSEPSIRSFLRPPFRSASGGFEVFIQKALEALTGLRFLRARSGSQLGRDLRTTTEAPICIPVEVKLYGESSALNERELLGEIRQALRELPDLDLWILATTAEVPDLLVRALQRELAESGRSFLALSFADGSTTRPSSLDVLAAVAESVFLHHLVGEGDHEAAKTKLFEIRAVGGFDTAYETLRNGLLRPETGFETWRRAQNRGMRWYFEHRDDVVAALGTDIAVEATGSQPIRRRQAESDLDVWWERWPVDRRPLVVLGGEGDGKSWAVASWLAARLHDDQFPAVLFISSRLCTTNVPAALFASQTEMVLRDSMTLRGDGWQKRLERWFRDHDGPRAVVVLDGVNERNDAGWWCELFRRLDAQVRLPNFLSEDVSGEQAPEQAPARSWLQAVALIVTVRKSAWQKYDDAKALRNPLLVEVGPFSESELEDALAARNESAANFATDLLELLAKPRLFELALRLKPQLEAAGEVTRARLLLEDWKDRIERRNELAGFGDREFTTLLKELALRFRSGVGTARWRELEELADSPQDFAKAETELRTGGIFDVEEGRWRLKSDYLCAGLGHVLAHEVRQAASLAQAEQIIAEHLVIKGLDENAEILDYALWIALAADGYPVDRKLVLLEASFEQQNPGDEVRLDFAHYLPREPVLWANLTEKLLEVHDRPHVRNSLRDAFVRWWPESVRIGAELRPRVERWLRQVPLGEPGWGPKTPTDSIRAVFEAIRQSCDREDIDFRLHLTEDVSETTQITDSKWLKASPARLDG